MASRREEQQAEIRLRVMRLISQKPDMSTRQVADEVGISNGSAYYVLTALVEKGFVKLGNFTKNPRKSQYAYLLTPKGIREKSFSRTASLSASGKNLRCCVTKSKLSKKR